MLIPPLFCFVLHCLFTIFFVRSLHVSLNYIFESFEINKIKQKIHPFTRRKESSAMAKHIISFYLSTYFDIFRTVIVVIACCKLFTVRSFKIVYYCLLFTHLPMRFGKNEVIYSDIDERRMPTEVSKAKHMPF